MKGRLMRPRSLISGTCALAVLGGGLVAADAGSATVLMDVFRTGGYEVTLTKTIMVPAWKIRRAKRVIAVMVGRTTEIDPTGAEVEGVPSEMEGQVKVVCTGYRSAVAQRTVRFAAEGDGQNGSIIRLPGFTGYGCGFRFDVVASWYPGANTLVDQWIGARIETA
jgi:hypothetical protein